MRSLLNRRSFVGGAATYLVALQGTASSAQSTAKIHEIKIQQFAFEPKALTVSVGDTIRWVNNDLAPHTATAVEYGWDTQELAQGSSVEIAVTKDMEQEYFCVFHPHMKGRIQIL